MTPTKRLAQPIWFTAAGYRGLWIKDILSSPAFQLLAVSCVWLLMVILVNPAGEYPLNDDWSYARPVQTLIENGQLKLTGFTSMPLVAQVLWGALFCLPFGFSFTALRVSTVTLGLIGILATYWLVEAISKNRGAALIAASVVAANPLYFNLSLTFMSDVSFFTFSLIAYIFLLRALNAEELPALFLGYAFTLVAILIRQLAIIIPISFLLAYFIKHRFSRKVFVKAFVPAAVFALLLLAYPFVLRHTIGLPALYNRSFEPISESVTEGWFQIPLIFADRLLMELVYLGLLILPFLIVLGPSHQLAFLKPLRSLPLFIGLILFILTVAFFLGQNRLMPLSGNILYNIGLGPLLLRDTYLLRLPHWPDAPMQIWLVVTMAGVLGGILFLFHMGDAVIRMLQQITAGSKEVLVSLSFLLSSVVLYLVLIGITGFLDRYLIWLLPLVMGIFVIRDNPFRSHAPVLPFLVSFTIILVYGLYALGGTHDYLSWNRVRWEAVTELMQKDNVLYNQIDGGFEFNGWYGYDAGYQIDESKSWWWVEGDEYIISFGPLLGYREVNRYPFARWIPPSIGNILVLQRFKE